MITKGCVYYTDFHADSAILKICKEQLKKSFDGEIISVSLNKPLDLGINIVLENRLRSYPTMALQIFMGLEASTADYVFLTEADVLYHKSHFDFTPPEDNIYYYNINNWRWEYPKDRAISYDGLISLSGLCVNRKFALEHYRMRLKKIEDMGLDKIKGREPRWVRKFGYEPGTKLRRRGGFSDDIHIKRRAAFPNIDIRHNKTFSKPKTRLKDFKHIPENWQEKTLNEIEGWELKTLFNL